MVKVLSHKTEAFNNHCGDMDVVGNPIKKALTWRSSSSSSSELNSVCPWQHQPSHLVSPYLFYQIVT